MNGFNVLEGIFILLNVNAGLIQWLHFSLDQVSCVVGEVEVSQEEFLRIVELQGSPFLFFCYS